MGPDLEKSKDTIGVLTTKDNVTVPSDQDDKLVQCVSNYEDNNFHEVQNDGLAELPAGSEDMEVNIIDCTKSGDNGQVETRHDDTTESMSSFGGTLSENENGSLLGDMEVESRLCTDDAPESVSDDFQMRRKKLTDHWRRFIRPLMWRCKWIELQLREFQSQALKYDRELAKHAQRKLFDFDTFVGEGFDTKSLPVSSCTQRKKVMKRKKRKRAEEMTDLTSYMLQHNLFSYYENKKSSVNSDLMNDDCSNRDKAFGATDDFGLQDGWSSFESKGDNSVHEKFLWEIESLQVQVRKLKARIERVVSENPGKFTSVNMLSMPTSPPGSEDQKPLRPLYTSSQQISDFNKGDVLPESGVSSHEEVTPLPDMIESIGQPQVGVSGENMGQEIRLDNKVVKEEMEDFKKNGSQLVEKHQEQVEEQKVTASEEETPAMTLVPRVNFGGKTLPKSRSNVPTNKRRRGRRRTSWNRRR